MSNKKGSAPPRYDEEFKKGAMALVTEKGMPLKTAAKDLGICPDTLRSWLNASGYKPAEVAKQHRADSRQKELEAEIKKLRKQLAEKDEVIEILQKSVGILSKPYRTNIALSMLTAPNSLWISYAVCSKLTGAAITPGSFAAFPSANARNKYCCAPSSPFISSIQLWVWTAFIIR